MYRGSRPLAVILSAALTMGTLPTIAMADPNSSASVSQDDLEAALAQLDSLGAQLSALDAQLMEAATELERTDNLIGRTQLEKGVTEQNLQAAREVLAARIRSAYKTGSFDALEFIMSAGSIDSMLSRFYYMDKIAQSDADAIAIVNDLSAELEMQKRQLEAKQAEQVERVDSIEAQVGEYESLVAEARAYYNQLDAQMQAEIARQAAAEAEAAAAAAANPTPEASSSSASSSSTTSETQTQPSAANPGGAATVLEVISEPEQPAVTPAPAPEPPAQQPTSSSGSSQQQSSSVDTSSQTATSSSNSQPEAKVEPEPEPEPTPAPQPAEPEPEPAPQPTTPDPAEEKDEDEKQASSSGEPFPGGGVASAYACLGYPYVWGGYLPSMGGFDCSGLVSYCFGDGTWRRGCESLANAIIQSGKWKSSVDELSVGDLVFTDSEFNHVQIYIGNGQVIHAPFPGRVVCIQDIYAFYGGGPFVKP